MPRLRAPVDDGKRYPLRTEPNVTARFQGLMERFATGVNQQFLNGRPASAPSTTTEPMDTSPLPTPPNRHFTSQPPWQDGYVWEHEFGSAEILTPTRRGTAFAMKRRKLDQGPDLDIQADTEVKDLSFIPNIIESTPASTAPLFHQFDLMQATSEVQPIRQQTLGQQPQPAPRASVRQNQPPFQIWQSPTQQPSSQRTYIKTPVHFKNFGRSQQRSQPLQARSGNIRPAQNTAPSGLQYQHQPIHRPIPQYPQTAPQSVMQNMQSNPNAFQPSAPTSPQAPGRRFDINVPPYPVYFPLPENGPPIPVHYPAGYQPPLPAFQPTAPPQTGFSMIGLNQSRTAYERSPLSVLNQIPTFTSSSDMSASAYIQNIEFVAEKYNLSDRETCEASLFCLRGNLRQKLQNRPEYPMCQTWQQLKALIIQEFELPPSLTKISGQLHTIKRKPSQTIREFNVKFREILSTLIGTPLLNMLFPIVYTNYLSAISDPRISVALSASMPKDLKDLLTKAEELSEILPKNFSEFTDLDRHRSTGSSFTDGKKHESFARPQRNNSNNDNNNNTNSRIRHFSLERHPAALHPPLREIDANDVQRAINLARQKTLSDDEDGYIVFPSDDSPSVFGLSENGSSSSTTMYSIEFPNHDLKAELAS